MMLRVLLLCCLLLCCTACREDQVPLATQVLQMDLPQFIHVQPDNSLVCLVDGELLTVRPGELPAQPPVAGSASSGQRRRPAGNKRLELLLPGPQGCYLRQERSLLFSLISSEGDIDLPEPETMSSILNFSMGGVVPQAGFLAEGPVGLYRGQLCVAYDMQGRERWQYMFDGYGAMAISAAGDRLCLAGAGSRAVCLDSAGQQLWERTGMFNLHCSGNGPLLQPTLLPGIVSLDWDGNVLWEAQWQTDDFRFQVHTSPNRPETVLAMHDRIAGYDEAGQLRWQHNFAGKRHYRGSLAADGHFFILLGNALEPDSLLNGRLVNWVPREFSLLCIGPEGKLLWQHELHSHLPNVLISGYAGHVYLDDDQNRLVCYGPAQD